ncbi:MAG: tetratricopeptide repeat protein [Comamonas sp.]
MHFLPISLFSRHLAVAALACCAALAHADEYSAVEKLLKGGRAQQALEQITDKVAKAPRDPQWRFLRGVAEANLGQADKAIATYTQLVEEYPELPEPYNNLAVLYAGQNQLEKASSALQAAIRANPQYATAHENLGDIYIKLAEKSYAQAIQLAPAQQSRLQPKISSLRLLVTPAQPAAGTPAEKNPVSAP